MMVPMRSLTRWFVIVLTLAALYAPAARADSPRLRADGRRIVDPAGNLVTLRGVNLGNWLLIEAGNFGRAFGEFPDQQTLFDALGDRLGAAERRRLIDIYRDSYITARDFDAVKRFGFNMVRVGFDYELLEDDDNPMRLRADAFKYLDFAVKEAKARGIYVLFDLHGAQERQVSGRQGGREGYSRFWKDAFAQERSLWMWEQIARHFKGETAVLGYEALNEPWSGTRDQLRDYCERWYAKLRPVDPDAVLVFPGWNDGIDFFGSPAEKKLTNMMFDMHFYPGSFARGTTTQPVTPRTNTRFIQRSLPQWADRMKRLDRPLLIGEMNVVFKAAGGGEMVRRYYDYAAEQGWAITLWTLKEFTREGGLHPSMWMLTTNATPLPTMDIRTSSADEIEKVFRGFATEPLADDADVLHWLTTPDKPSPLPASTQPATDESPTGAQPNATAPTGAQPNAVAP